MEYVKSVLASWKLSLSKPDTVPVLDLEMSPNAAKLKQSTNKIEDYRAGYPRFSALIAASDSFFVCRRFLRLRARILLLKQDRLSLLEQQLDQEDQDETSPLFLGKSRSDANVSRTALLSRIERCMADYDSFFERSQQMLNSNSALTRDVFSLQNWVNGTSSLSRDETTYLQNEKDLTCLATSRDSAIKKLEDLIEDQLIRYYRGFRGILSDNISIDDNVYICSGLFIKRTARALMLALISFFILMPIIACIVTSNALARTFVIMISTICYLLMLSWLTNPKTMELVLAGATFVTVLTVFVSGTNSGLS